MAFFKSKAEKEAIAEMEREESLQKFQENINTLKAKKDEFATIAAEAEINGDTATYDTAVNNLLQVTELISQLTQTKANYDIINVSNTINTTMATAVDALDKMASGGAKLPNIRKIQKTSVKINRYMRTVGISQKQMGRALQTSNPANKPRSAEEIASVRPLIDAARSRMGAKPLPKAAAQASAPVNNGLDLASEIEAEKGKII